MTLIIILNAVFSAFVLIGIVGIHLYAIATDRSDHARPARVPVTADGPTMESAREPMSRRGRAGRPAVGAIRVQREAASSQALS